MYMKSRHKERVVFPEMMNRKNDLRSSKGGVSE